MIRILSYWIYTATLFLTASTHLVNKITAGTGGIVSRYTPILLVLMITIGCYGLVYRRPLGNSMYWKVTVWILALFCLTCAGLFCYLRYLHESWFSHAGLWSVITFFLLFPAVIGLFQYAYRSHEIWQSSQFTHKE